MFKRIICLTLALCMLVSFTACKKNASEGSGYSEWEEEIVVKGGDAGNVSGAASGNGATTQTIVHKEEIDTSGTNSTAQGNTGTTNPADPNAVATASTANPDTVSNSTPNTTASTATHGTTNTTPDTTVSTAPTTSSPSTPTTPNGKVDTEAEKNKLDFKGETIIIMREWDPYKSGYNRAHDNFNTKLAECEKRFNVDIVGKKWKATLAGEMLSGVKPEGHYYLVGVTGGGNVYDMASKGYLAYMDDAMKATGIDMTADHYSPYNTGINNVNGKQWTIGFGFSRIQTAVYYNKKLLAEVGYARTLKTDTSVQSYIDSNTWTWDVMTEMAKKTTKRNSSGEVTQWGIGIGDITGMILSNGGHIIHPDKNGKFVSQLNTENVKEAVQQVYDWYHVDKVASAFSGGQWTSMGDAFAQKKIAFIFGGHAVGGTAYSNLTADDYGVAYLPMGPRMKKYVAHMTWEYSYVVPSTYQNRTKELLLLADELHEWPLEGYTRDDEFRDEWTRYFHSNEQYQMWWNQHFSNKVERVWDGSCIVTSGINFSDIVSGAMTPAVWVDTYSKAVNENAAAITNKYKYTGPLK